MISTRRPLFALMLMAVAALLARPALAVEAPEKAVPGQTMLMVWLDLEQIDGDMIDSVAGTITGMMNSDMVKNAGLGVPLGDPEDGAAGMIETRDAMVASGARGMLLMIDRPAEGNWSPAMRVLIKTTADADADKLAELAAGLTDGEMTAKAEPYAEGWHSLILHRVGEEDAAVSLPAVTDGDEEVAAQFNVQLKEHETAPFAVVFRMDETMKQMVDDMTAEAGQGQQQDPQMAMLMTMAGMLRGMDSLALSIADDQGLAINVGMKFEDQEQATGFLQMYNAIMMMAPALLAQQAQEIPNAPKPATINSFFAKLLMQPDGQTLRLKLDQSFFDLAQELSPMLEGMGINPQNFNLDL